MHRIVIVTGASRGFGRAVVATFAKNASFPHHFVISGTDEVELNNTAALLTNTETSTLLTHSIVKADLSKVEDLSKFASSFFDLSNEAYSNCTELFFINNAGSLGPLSPIGSETHEIANYIAAYNINITSTCYLSSELVARCNKPEYLPQCKQVTIVNVSSLAAIQAFGSWSLYCAGKAARDMYHKCLAEEQMAAPASGRVIKVLNYAPGPLDTNMQKEIREGPSVDPATREYYKGMKEKNQLVAPDTSADKLIALLVKENGYESGSHVDYFDI